MIEPAVKLPPIVVMEPLNFGDGPFREYVLPVSGLARWPSCEHAYAVGRGDIITPRCPQCGRESSRVEFGAREPEPVLHGDFIRRDGSHSDTYNREPPAATPDEAAMVTVRRMVVDMEREALAANDRAAELWNRAAALRAILGPQNEPPEPDPNRIIPAPHDGQKPGHPYDL